MKKILLLSFMTGCGLVQAQTFEYLDANNIKARVDTSGLLFKDPVTGDPGFEVPKGSSKHTITGSHILLGGLTTGSLLSLAASDLYYLHDFQPGPLTPGTATASILPMWNRVWKISLSEINYHIAHYADPGYVPAPIITDWPAISEFGTMIAPFHDHNSDGNYVPLDGDYPVIKGTQAVFQVFNDMLIHETGSQPMGVEIHAMTYVFNCDSDSALNNTVFVNYKIINRSTQTFLNTYMGVNNELSIGNPTDNFTGCDVERGMYYGYNGDNMDEADVASVNYNTIMPVQGVIVLGGPYADSDAIDNLYFNDYAAAIANGGIPYEGLGLNYNNGVVDDERLGLRKFMSYNENATIEVIPPYNGSMFYNGLKGLWNDGSQPVWGGLGYPGTSGATTIEVDYLHYSNTDSVYWASRGVVTDQTVNPWGEQLHGNPAAGRKTIGSFGPFTLLPGAFNEVDVAYTTAFNYTSPGLPMAALPVLQQRADSIRSYFLSGTTPCGDFIFNGVTESEMELTGFSVYPNPVNHSLNVQLKNSLNRAHYQVYDVFGKLVANGSINANTITIETSQLQEGVYVLSINGVGTERFIVQH